MFSAPQYNAAQVTTQTANDRQGAIAAAFGQFHWTKAFGKRSGLTYQNTDTPDPTEPALNIWPSPAFSGPLAPLPCQGYATNTLNLVTRYAATPYSPRSPPVLA